MKVSEAPRLSVIVPTCNRNEALAKCLDQIAPGAQSLAFEHYEVIVSDDGLNNTAESMILEKYPWVRYLAGPRRGPAANRNNGAHLATGEWLVFTDDDCLPDAGWLQAYAEAINQFPDSKAFEGMILPDDWDLLKRDMAECPVNTTGDAFWSANIMVEGDLFWKVGGFDERFKIAAQEDQDLQLKLLERAAIRFIGNAAVTHPVRVVPFTKKLVTVPQGIRNWYQFSINHNSFVKTIIKGLLSQFVSCCKNVANYKFQSALINIFSILIVVPICIIAAIKE